jgi:thymidylate synthase
MREHYSAYEYDFKDLVHRVLGSEEQIKICNIMVDATPVLFPMLSLRYVDFDAVCSMLIWALRGKTNNSELEELGCDTLSEFANFEATKRFERHTGDLGPMFGHQWRHYGMMYEDSGSDEDLCAVSGCDQFSDLFAQLKTRCDSTDLIILNRHPHQKKMVAYKDKIISMQFFTNFESIHPVYDLVLNTTDVNVFEELPEIICMYALLLNLVAWLQGASVGSLYVNMTLPHLRGCEETANSYAVNVVQKTIAIPPRLVISEELERVGIEDMHRVACKDFTVSGYRYLLPLR